MSLERRLVGPDRKAAFEEAYRQYSRRVHEYVSARVDPRYVDDLTSDVFTRAYEALPTYLSGGPGSFGGWLFKIAHNCVVDHYRRRRPDVDIDDVVAHISDPLASLEDHARRVEVTRVVRGAIRRLPPNQREAIRLRYYHDSSCEESARRLRTSVGVVKSRQHRAEQNLRGLLERYHGPGR
jgi:RNA polymerase sigma-70 factor (ECF subfamily)